MLSSRYLVYYATVALTFIGLILGLSNILGARVAGRMGLERRAIFVRWLLIAVVAVSAAQLLGLFDLVAQIF